MKENPFLRAIKDKSFRENLIDSHTYGITKKAEFSKLLEYFYDKKAHLFTTNDFAGKVYDGDDDILDLIVPSIRSIWGKVFISPPKILRMEGLELFQLSFDFDHFIDYLIDILPKVKESLIHFENLDRSVETLNLVIDNYLAYMLKNCKSEDIRSQIRDIKIRNVIND